MTGQTTDKKAPKVLLIGLDGIPCTLLNDYMERGLLPGFKKILGDGFNLHQMDASVPDVSSTSWTSFMTGVNPAEHGIYGFTDLKPGSLSIFVPNSRNVNAPAIWDIIGRTANGRTSTLYENYREAFQRPLRSIVLNIPQTFPALNLNGILTAGFVCPDLRKGTYPEKAYDYLNSIGYLSDVDSAKAAVRKDEFFNEVFLALEKRMQAYEHFLKNEEWDFFAGVITETDRLHHFFFDAAYDPKHADHEVFLRFYRELDRAVSGLYELFMDMTGGKGLFLTMSDHGFTVLKEEVYINAWLKKEGFLRLNGQKEYFEQVDAGTKAFAMDPARIYINLEGKYPGGCVKPAERESVVRDLKERLKTLTGGGNRPVIREILENHELYSGPLSDRGPDLVCLANDGFDLKSNLKKDEIFGKGHFTGMHTSYDAHCILPKGVEITKRLHIEHLAGIILEHLKNGIAA